MAGDLNLDAAVEEAARCLWEDVFSFNPETDTPWAGIDEMVVRGGMLADAETLVAAILPHLREQIVRQERDRIADEIEARIQRIRDTDGRGTNGCCEECAMDELGEAIAIVRGSGHNPPDGGQ